MFRLSISSIMACAFISAPAFANPNSCQDLFHNKSSAGHELSDIERQLINAKSNDERTSILVDAFRVHVEKLDAERTKKIEEFNASAPALGQPLIRALNNAAKARDAGSLMHKDVLEVEKQLLVDEVTEQWSETSRRFLRDYVVTTGSAALKVEDAILTARYVSEDPTLNPKQSLLAAEIFGRMTEIAAWMKAAEKVEKLQSATEVFALSKSELEAKANSLLNEAIRSKVISPIDQTELLKLRTSRPYLLTSPLFEPGIQRSDAYAWAYREMVSGRVNQVGPILQAQRRELVVRIRDYISPIILLELVLSPSKSVYLAVQKNVIKTQYTFPAQMPEPQRLEELGKGMIRGIE